MVAIQENYRTETNENTWWAYSRNNGWVLLDRGLVVNRTTTMPALMQFVRCADWTAYQQGDGAWDYQEAEQYLESLSYDEAYEAENQLSLLQEEYAARVA